MNAELPILIKQKIQKNPSFLATIQNLTDTSEKNYWSFPEYKDVGTAVNTSLDQASGFKDSMSKYLNFPDSTLYLIGFKYKKPSSRVSTPLEQNLDLKTTD